MECILSKVKVQILSFPSGLYGHEIRPKSFYLSSSLHEVIDDSEGNLIISGTNINDYPTDVRSNVFRLDPIKAFKVYDLQIFPGYAVTLRDPLGNPWDAIKLGWRRGERNPNYFRLYTSPFLF